MKQFHGKALRWEWRDGVVELALDHAPINEIGTVMLADLEQFAAAIPALAPETSACIVHSERKEGFCAGADLRELYRGAEALAEKERIVGVRNFLERIHAVANAIDAAPFVTIGAVHGVCFGGGLELALLCDIIVADTNFGCGSSREVAPIAIKASGTSAVIAKSFARIFYRNALNIGLPIFESAEAVDGIESGDEIELEPAGGIVRNLTKGTSYRAAEFPPFMQSLIDAGGLVPYVERRLAESQ